MTMTPVEADLTVEVKEKLFLAYTETVAEMRQQILATREEGLRQGEPEEKYPPEGLIRRGFEMEERQVTLRLPRYIWTMHDRVEVELPNVSMTDLLSNVLVNRFLKEAHPLLRLTVIMSGLAAMATPDELPPGARELFEQQKAEAH